MNDHDPKSLMRLADEALSNLATSKHLLVYLLEMKKASEGIEKDQPLFLGMANLAEYFWCAEKSYLKSKKNEIDFFYAYISDRLRYSIELGHTSKVPSKLEDLLMVGEEIDFNDIEHLLSEKKPATARRDPMQSNVAQVGFWRTLGAENGILYILGFPDEGAKQVNLKDFNYLDAKFVNSADDPNLPPKLRGVVGEDEYSEQYPRIRWNFNWEEYFIVGVPDGITEHFVYEFKTTRSPFLFGFIKPVAKTQADFYGYFFRRKEKRVQIRIYENGEIWTEQSPIDGNRIESVYKGFSSIAAGNKPFPPKPWKCKHCEFKGDCSISQA